MDEVLSPASSIPLYLLCGCGNKMYRYFSPPPPASVMEMGDKYHNKSYKKGIQKVLKQRSRNDLLNKVGELVEKHGMEALRTTTLLKNGKKRTVWDDK